jgi:hypothetical protein
VGEADAESPRPLRRRVAYVCGQWRVTYSCSGEPGPETALRCGLLVGPLVPDLSTVLWVAVVPDGSMQRTMIRRDSITNLAPPPRHGR